jgi:hypothetical protein
VMAMMTVVITQTKPSVRLLLVLRAAIGQYACLIILSVTQLHSIRWQEDY